jgi:hypothetical protein
MANLYRELGDAPFAAGANVVTIKPSKSYMGMTAK